MNGICVPSRGKSGLDDKLDWWHFTGIYGEPDTSKRERTWNLLTRLWINLIGHGSVPEILMKYRVSQKNLGTASPDLATPKLPSSDRQMCLSDLGFIGPPFTWCNRHSAPTTVRERLDRACANSEWTHLFPDVSVTHEPMNCSDHATLIIRLTDTPKFRSHTARPWSF
ncbi:hypothetical protein Sango_2936800 [Sesamum angolense]|uniref:Endonuclease/exonuclease/phosphatase domain-containing protein n=1 Tax=Sesamum angolense TaxID=2727404 RepID=A0AAE1VZS3_9LAMI|nr:hypothetical protein Sango_2936800 [Sesamum angolense]